MFQVCGQGFWGAGPIDSHPWRSVCLCFLHVELVTFYLEYTVYKNLPGPDGNVVPGEIYVELVLDGNLWQRVAAHRGQRCGTVFASYLCL